LIGNDQRASTFVAISVLAFSIFALAGSASATPQGSSVALPPSAAALPASTVLLVQNGIASSVVTTAPDVASLLAQRDIQLAPDDYLSIAPNSPIGDGMTIVYRAAVPLTLQIGNVRRTALSSAATVRDFLSSQNVSLRASDQVTPDLDAAPQSGDVVRIVRIATWLEHLRKSIPPQVVHRADPELPAGATHTLDAGAPGLRELTFKIVNRGEVETRTLVSQRVLRKPRTRVVARGTGDGSFSATTRLLVSSMRMIATAYIASCYGCSGITASGVPAGHGIVAVDPHVIPLGTHLYIPGYGRAVAGDTGGDINGHRIDLGMNHLGDALRFGRRAITVYVLQ